MHDNGIDKGACAVNCREKYGKCYYNNGSWCANTGAFWDGCWEKSPGHDNGRHQRSTSPIQALKPHCNFNPLNLSNACRNLNFEMCPGILKATLHEIGTAFN
jgi:hypothetical protein